MIPVQKGSGIEHFQTRRTGLSDTGTRQPCILSSHHIHHITICHHILLSKFFVCYNYCFLLLTLCEQIFNSHREGRTRSGLLGVIIPLETWSHDVTYYQKKYTILWGFAHQSNTELNQSKTMDPPSSSSLPYNIKNPRPPLGFFGKSII